MEAYKKIGKLENVVYIRTLTSCGDMPIHAFDREAILVTYEVNGSALFYSNGYGSYIALDFCPFGYYKLIEKAVTMATIDIRSWAARQARANPSLYEALAIP